MKKEKLLIVSYFFPPINNIAARRWSEMVEELECFFDVYVITQNGEGSLQVPLTDDKIFRFGSFSNHVEKVEDKRNRPLYNWISKNITHDIRSFDNTYSSWYLRYKTELGKLFLKIDPKVLVTTFGPIGPSFIGKYFKYLNPQVYWIVDFRDSVSILNRDIKNPFQIFIDERLDKYVHRKANMLLTVSTTLASLLKDFYKKEVFTIYNGFSNKHCNVLGQKCYNNSYAYYAGYIYKHRLAAFLMFCKASYNLGIQVKIRLLSSAQERKEIQEIVSLKGFSNVEILMPASADIISAEELAAGALLIFEDLSNTNLVTKGNLTGKLFEYLIFPAPIIAVCRGDSEIKEVLDVCKRGKVVSSEDEIREAWEKKENFILKDPSQIIQFSRNSQARKFIKLLEIK